MPSLGDMSSIALNDYKSKYQRFGISAGAGPIYAAPVDKAIPALDFGAGCLYNDDEDEA